MLGRFLPVATMVNAAAVAFIVWNTLPAQAQDRAEWGNGTISFVELELVDAGAHVANVTLYNEITTGHDAIQYFRLKMAVWEVMVNVGAGSEMKPDRLSVYPPPGFIAVPERIDVEEGESGTIEIYMEVGS